jgi:predicted RNA binding protein YcfA (HicA-like mRNA interferase family)
MADTDVEKLRDMLPELFQQHQVAPDWDDYVFDDASIVDEQLVEQLVELEVDPEESLRKSLDDLADRLGGDHPGNICKPPPRGTTLSPDCLAFYLPFHHYDDNWWGVYLILDGIAYLASWLLQDSRRRGDRSLTRADCWRASKRFLFYHNIFHHRVESFATRLEIAHGLHLYARCFRDLYTKNVGTASCIEESLANAHAYQQAIPPRVFSSPRKRKALANSFRAYISMSPPGYKEASNFLKQHQYRDALYDFAEANFEHCFKPTRKRPSQVWRTANFRFTGFNPKGAGRTWYVVSRSSPLAARIPLLPQLKPRDVRKKLRKLGCEKLPEGGKHEIWRGRTGEEIEIPRHPRGLAPGTLRSIIKEAGLEMGLKEFANL